MFTPRPSGLTLRRLEHALIQPHPTSERFDPDFLVAMHCKKCGKVGHGPRGQLQEALREHMQSECSARHKDGPQITQVISPRL